MASAIPPHVVQAVRDAADLLALVGEHTSLRRQGKRWIGLCPFHREKSPSFGVDAEEGLYYCFGCGAGGDAIKFHMAVTGDDFATAIESLASRYSISWTPGKGPSPRAAAVADALAAAERHFRSQLARSAEAKAYLERRRVPPAIVERFRLGLAPAGWRGLLDALGRTVRAELLAEAGLVSRSDRDDRFYDRFRHRLMFPIHSESGRLVGFGGRTLGDDPAKYLNTPETGSFHKGRLVYGLDLAKKAVRDRGRAILAEGYFDVIACACAGHEEAVATMGTALTPEQAALLARYTGEVIVAYDGDAAGEKAHLRALPILLAAGLAVRRLVLPAGQDPDSLRLEAGEQELSRRLEEAPDAIDREIERLAPSGTRLGARQQAERAAAIAALLAPVRDPIARHAWARGAAERLGVPVELILERSRALGRAPRGAATPPAGATARPTPREPGLENRLVEHLLATLDVREETPAARAALAALPPTAAFSDPACRNILAALRDLAEEGRLFREALVTALVEDEIALDEISRILLAEPQPLAPRELASSLAHLRDRSLKLCLKEFKPRIDAAQREGDLAAVERLVLEKERQVDELRRVFDLRGPGSGRVSSAAERGGTE